MRIVKLAAMAVMLACGPEPEPTSISDAALPQWNVSSEPIFQLGVLEGDPDLQFFRISGLARLGNDRLVVANSGTQELRYFNSEGRLLDRAGGRGRGPGEFSFLRDVYAVSPDSLLAFEGSWRGAYYDSTGNFLSTWLLEGDSSRAVPRGLWVFRRNLIDGLPVGRTVEETKRFLSRLPPPVEEPWYWYVRFDSAGYTWVSDDVVPGRERSDWTIVDTTGTAVARVGLPPRFEMFEATDGDILGRWRDENDVEYVHIYALTKPTYEADAARDPLLLDTAISVAGAEIEPELLAGIGSALRNLVTAQEQYYGDHSSYTANRHDLTNYAPEGLVYDFITAGPRGWIAVISGPELPVICGIAVGIPTPRGWQEGMPFCADIE